MRGRHAPRARSAPAARAEAAADCGSSVVTSVTRPHPRGSVMPAESHPHRSSIDDIIDLYKERCRSHPAQRTASQDARRASSGARGARTVCRGAATVHAADSHVSDFEGLLNALVASGVEFILVGGLAARAHGAARSTQDVDVVYARHRPARRHSGRRRLR